VNQFEPRVLTLDIETRRLASEVGGWPRLLAGAGGISALVIHDSLTGRFHCFNDDTIREAAELIEQPGVVVCSFNGSKFDLPVIEAVLGRTLSVPHHFDLLALIWAALTPGEPKKANSLCEVAQRTLGVGKTGQSAHAPELADKGLWLTLFRYCKKDVDLTRRLFDFARQHGGVISHTGEILHLNLPEWFRKEN
jgi:DEAD/DEAH box helicase domain-containing protein